MEPRTLLEQRIPVAESRQTVADKHYAAMMERKWEPWLDGLGRTSYRDAHARKVTAICMENQAQYHNSMTEDIRTANMGAYQKYVFPALRRSVPNLIAHDLVSVQPLTAPLGVVFYYDLVYDMTKGQTQAGNIFPRDFDPNYTAEIVDGEPLATGNGTDYGGAAGGHVTIGANLMFFPVRIPNASRGYRVTIEEVDSTGDVIQSAVDKLDGTGGFDFTPSGVNTSGQINYANGQLSNFNFQNAPASGNKVKITYYYDMESNGRIPSNKFDIKLGEVRVRSRKLKTTFSLESAQDAKALHAFDIEQEMVQNSSQQISLEVDREILAELLASSTGTSDVYDRAVPMGRDELAHFRSALTKISGISHQIQKKTLRAPANWIVCSPEISSILEQLTTHQDYRPIWVSGDPSPFNGAPMDMPRPLVQQGQFGIYRMGTLHNRWMVYVDPLFPTDFLLMGLKGASFTEAGYVYCPYIPLLFTQSFEDPNTQTVVKGLMTRYATKLIREDYFGQIRWLNVA